VCLFACEHLLLYSRGADAGKRRSERGMLLRELVRSSLDPDFVCPAAAPIFVFPCGTQECWQQD
jgi:hypothetical protein